MQVMSRMRDANSPSTQTILSTLTIAVLALETTIWPFGLLDFWNRFPDTNPNKEGSYDGKGRVDSRKERLGGRNYHVFKAAPRTSDHCSLKYRQRL